MAKASDILRALEDYEQNDPESRGVLLRLNLAEIVLRRLDALGWTQAKLAEETGKKESFISRIIHSDANCEFDTAGRILFALGVEAELTEKTPAGQSVTLRFRAETAASVQFTHQDWGYAENEEIENERVESTREEVSCGQASQLVQSS
jgi:transcriptional regulator with XRE-family HTH domain